MLSQQYHNQQIYESITDQKNAQLNVRNNQMSSYWNEYIPVKYNFLEHQDDPKYIPGFDCKFKQTIPYYRQELAYMPVPRSQESEMHRTQMVENQVKHDYQSKRFDIQIPKDYNESLFGKKIEYNKQVDQLRQQTLQNEVQKVCNIQNQQYNQQVQEVLASQPKTKKFKLSSQQHRECQEYCNGSSKELQIKKQSYQQNTQNQFVPNIQQQRQQQQFQVRQQDNQLQYDNQQHQFIDQSLIHHQDPHFRNEAFIAKQQPQGFVLNPRNFQQKLELQHSQQIPQITEGVNFNPLNNQERMSQTLKSQNESAFTFNMHPQEIKKTQKHHQTGHRFFPQESYFDQYLYESDLAKRRIHDTRMLNRAISEEHLFFTSQNPRFRAPFHEAQGLESNSFYAKPNLYKYSTPILY